MRSGQGHAQLAIAREVIDDIVRAKSASTFERIVHEFQIPAFVSTSERLAINAEDSLDIYDHAVTTHHHGEPIGIRNGDVLPRVLRDDAVVSSRFLRCECIEPCDDSCIDIPTIHAR